MAVYLIFACSHMVAQSGEGLVTVNDCWTYRLESPMRFAPSVDAANLYFAGEGRVSALLLASGSRLWSTEIGGEVTSNIVVAGSSVVFVSTAAGGRSVLRALSTLSGLPQRETPMAANGSVRLGMSGGRIVAVSEGGKVRAFEAADLSQAWEVSLPQPVTGSPLFAKDVVVVPSEKTIQAIAAATGKVLITAAAEYPVTSLGKIEEDILWGEERGLLVRFDAEDRYVSWKYKNGARISSIVATERGVVATSSDNFVYLISGYNGDIRWKTRMSGRIFSLTVSGDLAVVLTVGDPNAVFLDLETGKRSGQIAVREGEGYAFPVLVAADEVLLITGTQVLAKGFKPCGAK